MNEITCDCGAIPPTMPVYRDTHLATCAVAKAFGPKSSGDAFHLIARWAAIQHHRATDWDGPPDSAVAAWLDKELIPLERRLDEIAPGWHSDWQKYPRRSVPLSEPSSSEPLEGFRPEDIEALRKREERYRRSRDESDYAGAEPSSSEEGEA